jgi:putative peptidoglycan lipid II flippase
VRHFARSTIIVALFFAIEKALGFLRQIMMARQFGLSGQLDAFNAANNLPDLLFALISGGALSLAFIPVLAEHLAKRGREAAWLLFARVANLFFLVTALISLLIAFFADPLVRWRFGIAPGFPPEQQALVADLMRLGLLATLLFSLSSLVTAGLQAHQHFFLPALGMVLFDIGAFAGVLVLAPSAGLRFGPLSLPAFGLGVYGLVYGVIFGALLYFAAQVPALLRYGFRWVPAIGLGDPGLRRVLALMGPRILTMFAIQFVFLAQDNIASHLVTGSVTALTYAWLFMRVPESLIGQVLGTVALPTLSEQAALDRRQAFQTSLERVLRLTLALALPGAALLAVGLPPLVGVLGFGAAGTELVVWTTRALMISLVAHAMLEVITRAFYARQDALTPLTTSTLAAGTFVVLALAFSRWLGVAGISLANGVAYGGEALLMLWLLNRRLERRIRLNGTLLRAGLVAAGSGLLAYALLRLPLPALPLALAALSLAGLLALPFLWPEVKLLLSL